MTSRLARIMIERIFALILLTILPVVVSSVTATSYAAAPKANPPLAEAIDYVSPQPSVETLTRFSEEEIQVSTPIPFETEYVDDPESEIGTEAIRQEGINGQRVEFYLVKYWYGEETERVLLDVKTEPPQKQIVARGTKIIWRDLETSDYGTLKYWRKLRVWATSYDGNCPGCRGRTFSGTPVTYGTLAVDPAVIPLGTRVYIPGYGIGEAEDIGGGIKGNMIDLGFDDVSEGWWRAQWADVYLLE